MIRNKSDTLLTIAEELLAAAENEKERAEADVVTHLICANSRQSLCSFLTGFLLRQHIAMDHPASLVSLLEQCKSVDARFESIDLSHVLCRFETHDLDYCLDLEQVDACIKVAQQARSIVMSNTPAY